MGYGWISFLIACIGIALAIIQVVLVWAIYRELRLVRRERIGKW